MLQKDGQGITLCTLKMARYVLQNITLFPLFKTHNDMVCRHPDLESPIISFWHFPGLESPGQRLKVLESHGNLLNSSSKAFRIYII